MSSRSEKGRWVRSGVSDPDRLACTRDDEALCYYLSNLPPHTSRRALAGTVKARWVCEQAHQQLKEELGLDHFEGRSWTGLHRHALMTCIACA